MSSNFMQEHDQFYSENPRHMLFIWEGRYGTADEWSPCRDNCYTIENTYNSDVTCVTIDCFLPPNKIENIYHEQLVRLKNGMMRTYHANTGRIIKEIYITAEQFRESFKFKYTNIGFYIEFTTDTDRSWSFEHYNDGDFSSEVTIQYEDIDVLELEGLYDRHQHSILDWIELTESDVVANIKKLRSKLPIEVANEFNHKTGCEMVKLIDMYLMRIVSLTTLINAPDVDEPEDIYDWNYDIKEIDPRVPDDKDSPSVE